jgi:saccharopine dehydrogenase-like NADP-dependent oxidoreductase
MKKILLFGAGKSSSFLIKYLIQHAAENNWVVQIVDQNTKHIQDKYGVVNHLQLFTTDVFNNAERAELIQHAELVISLLPPSLHIVVAKDCLLYAKNLITASYVSDEIKAMDAELKEKKVLFMCEMGLDPGIDHMSAMKIIDEIAKENGEIFEFKSHCGGLVAPESDTNPWHYKISWNPRNVITAGAAGAHFLLNKQEYKIDYPQIFKNNQTIQVNGIGQLAYYPNRDSLSYQALYDLKNVDTLERTTLRYPAYSAAWQYIIDMGLTNEKGKLYDTENLTFEAWLQDVLQTNNVAEKLNSIFGNDAVSQKLFDYLDLTSRQFINIGTQKSNADILQSVIEQKWKMQDTDKDMIVMQHEFKYRKAGKATYLKSTLIVKGEDKTYTAMAKTVGLPMAILAKLILTEKVTALYGVNIPVMQKVYAPVLQELVEQGIIFEEEIV